MSENTWQEKFSFVNQNFPEAPDLTNYVKAIDAINNERDRVYKSLDSNIYKSDEPKIIIKIPSTPYQQKNFNENYTFAFQSLISGRKSSFIKLTDREKYGISEKDKIKGGIFPNELNLSDNLQLWENHFYNMFKLIFDKRSELLRSYYSIVNEVKGDWWEVYHNYLKSEERKLKRNNRLLLDDYKCFFHNIKGCDSNNLHVHHIHYDNVGNEMLEDLVTVCKDCHSEIHGRTL